MSISGTSFASTSSFKRDIPVIASLVDSLIKYTEDPQLGSGNTAKIIAEYMSSNQNPFGAAEWKQYFGVDVGPETPFEAGFDEWWNGPDPVDVYNRAPKLKACIGNSLTPRFCTWGFYGYSRKNLARTKPPNFKPSGIEIFT